MKFGMFMSPYHVPGESPSVALHDDLELVEHLDRLGFDEVWVGEHHSGGFEIVSSPDIFIAAAAQRTRDIRFGTGVTSVPYHHPLVTAGRITLLDNLTRGRVMFGAGPGALVTDAKMMGIDPNSQRHMLESGLDAIYRLLKGEVVNMKNDWFTLEDAQLQLPTYKCREMDLALASVRSPSGARLAGRYGAGLLSIAATDPEGGFNFLKDTWSLMEESAQEHGQNVDRGNWRLSTTMHLSTTREQAAEDLRHGYAPLARFGSTGPFGGGEDIEDYLASTSHEQLIESANESGGAIFGTPDMAIEQIRRLEKQTGGFGTLLLFGHGMVNFEANKKSLELFAKYVMPEFQGTARPLVAAWDRLYEGRKEYSSAFRGAQDKAIAEYNAEKSGQVPVTTHQSLVDADFS